MYVTPISRDNWIKGSTSSRLSSMSTEIICTRLRRSGRCLWNSSSARTPRSHAPGVLAGHHAWPDRDSRSTPKFPAAQREESRATVSSTNQPLVIRIGK